MEECKDGIEMESALSCSVCEYPFGVCLVSFTGMETEMGSIISTL